MLIAALGMTDVLRTSLSQACDEIRALETQMRAVERQLGVLARDRDDLKLLQTIPGIGVLTATALVALVGDIRRFVQPRVCEFPGSDTERRLQRRSPAPRCDQ